MSVDMKIEGYVSVQEAAREVGCVDDALARVAESRGGSPAGGEWVATTMAVHQAVCASGDRSRDPQATRGGGEVREVVREELRAAFEEFTGPAKK